MTGLLEAIAYALARGFFKAWLEHQADIAAADLENPDDKARNHARNLRAAVQRLRDKGRDSGPVSPAPGQPGVDGDRVGTTP